MVPTEVDTPEARAERAALALVDQAHNAEAEDAAVVAAGNEAERAVAAELAEPAPMSPTTESAPMVPPQCLCEAGEFHVRIRKYYTNS